MSETSTQEKATASKVKLEELITWQDSIQGNESAHNEAKAPPNFKSKFPFSASFNKKLILWKGDILRVDVDCLVSPNNESLTEVGGIADRVFRAAGEELVPEIEGLEGCRTGEAKATSGYNIIARHIFHTVGPKYHPKYRVAAENALHSCYLNCLQLMKEKKLTSIAFPVIHSEKRGYPPQEGAHIAIRTIRRFLERFGDKIETIVLCIEESSLYQIYDEIMALYFPRSQGEAIQVASNLPEDIGNEIGETVVPERQIRINAFPAPLRDSSDEEEEEEEDEKLAASKLTVIEENPDALRKVSNPPSEPIPPEIEESYRSLMLKARTTDVSHIAKMKLAYPAGVTSAGEPILVVFGKLFASKKLNMEHVLIYLLKTMESFNSRNFILVYLHGEVTETPDFAWQRTAYNIFEAKYCSRLKQCFVVHASLWVKLFFTVLTPFLSSDFRKKLHYVDLKRLFTFVDRNSITLPPEVFHHDQRETGTNWFQSSPMNPHDQL